MFFAASGSGKALATQLFVLSAVVLVSLLIERWRYKRVSDLRPEPGWEDTGERFRDTQTGRLMAVYFDPATAQRHYVVVPDVPRR
ncbi:hypothetical protein BW247_10280 [Acidihalobacter ferrooxydans]|uniref:Uncharacterized protein n=1 Tax=Acidihalobacter ferrooxydans TaxID=1765967 RepID=A0A1P8ULG0_9GAMM|nr:hypothetical protein BW247_10280 [Acidihalobacter ferrooxydans]